MISPRTSSCGGAGALWLLLAASISSSPAADPGWWSQPATKIWTSAAAAADHQSPVNVGQLKHVASRARIYLDNVLTSRRVADGAGARIRNMVDGKAGTAETGFTAGGSNASIANVGQLKRVASAFYLRFAEVDPLTAPAIVLDLQKRMGLSTAFQTRPAPGLREYVLPWLTAPSDEDQAPATVGQLKMLFSFDLSAFPRFPLDSDGDEVPDAREYALHSNPRLADSDGDGIGDYEEAASQEQENVVDFYNGVNPAVSIMGAFSPQRRIPVGAAGTWIDQPLTVKVMDPQSEEPLVNAPVLFTVTKGGGGLGSFHPSATEVSVPVMEARTDAAGMIRLSVKTGPSTGSASTFAFWAVTRDQPAEGGQFTAWSGASLDFTADSTVFWLKPEQQVTLEDGHRVIKWSDPVSNRSAASAGLARPQFIERNGFPLLNFDGTARLFLDRIVSVSDGGISLFTVTLPEADRTVHPVLNNPARGTIYANNGQRVLLAGAKQSAPDAPFTYSGGTPSTVSDTRYFSRYTQKAFGGAPYQAYSVPDPISSGLDPGLAASSKPQIRYDVTPDAVSTGQQNRKLRSNPNVTNFPLFSGKSESECAARMRTDLGLSGNLAWTSSSIRATYTRPGTGTVPVDQSQEVYYKLEGKTPATNGTYTFAPGLIGDITPVISLGSNSLGTYQYHTQFGPCLGSAALPAAPADGSLRLITAQVPSNGGLATFVQGSPVASSSTSSAGGRDTGYWLIGSYQDGDNSFVGKLGDMLIVRGIADATSRQVIEDRLASRYQLAVDRGAVSGGTANSLPDWWERALLGSRYATAASGSTAATPASFATPTADPDGDTLTNAREWTLGTNPALADSDGDGSSDKIETASGSLTKATNPDTDKDGFPDGADSLPANPANGLADTNPKNGRPDGLDYLLSRPVADNGNPDTDQDGLSDLFELTVTHTSATSEDSDGDYLSDKWEYENFLNPLTAIGDHGSEGDKDGDGLGNFAEWTNGSNPNQKDSDGDGVNDATEVAGHSNPADASDKGQSVPDDQVKMVNFHFYGDFAAWEITIQGTGKHARKWQYRTDTPGQIKDVPVDLKPGNPYEIRLKWLKSRKDEEKDWYCWEAQVDSLPNTQTFGDFVSTRITGAAEYFSVGGHWIADNRSGLLTAHVHMKDGGGGNVAGPLTVNLIPVEVSTDTDNNGQVNSTDTSLAQGAYTAGATPAAIDKATEFIFANDSLSNGAWDKDDSTTPGKPATATDDDDAEEIQIKLTGLPDGAEVWLEHPAIAGLSFYTTRKCLPAEKVNLSPSQHYIVSSTNPISKLAKLYVRADGTIPWASATDPQVEGDLKLMLKPNSTATAMESVKMKFTVIKELGAKKYFHAANDYIGENNSRLCAREKAYGSAAYRIVSMRNDKTTMYPIDAARRTSGGQLKGIDAVVAQYADISVVVNGNQCFFADDRNAYLAGLSGEMTDKCHGRVVRFGTLDTAVSSDNYDKTTSPAGSELAAPEPIPGLSPTDPNSRGGNYVAQYDAQKKFVLAAGRVPLSGTTPDQPVGNPNAAMGGLSANSARRQTGGEVQSIGIAPVASDGSTEILFVASQSAGTGRGGDLAADAKNSGVKDLPGGRTGELQLLFLDGSTSVALAHMNGSDSLKTIIKGSKHSGSPYYYVNTYLLFRCEKPRP